MWIHDEPDRLPAHLRDVQLHEYTENVPREHNRNTGRCGAMPARVFRPQYPEGCRRERGHEGSHSGLMKTAHTLDRRVRDRKARERGWHTN